MSHGWGGLISPITGLAVLASFFGNQDLHAGQAGSSASA
jgi:hypothetical protein